MDISYDGKSTTEEVGNVRIIVDCVETGVVMDIFLTLIAQIKE